MFKSGALRDQRGRTELLIFSGYYGLWLGIATPVALDATLPQGVALGLLLGAPVSFVAARQLTREAEMSRGRSIIILLGGYWGTWQGIGWSIVAKQEARFAVGMGELLGLAGVGLSSLLTRDRVPSEGHAALTSAGLEWGAWFGVIGAILAKDDSEDKNMLRDMLIGSNLTILANSWFFRHTQMSQTRVRLINLAGVAGAITGFGVDLLFEISDLRTVFSIAGTASVLGLLAGKRWTRNFDAPEAVARISAARKIELSPMITLRYARNTGTDPTPMAGFQLSF